MTKISGLLAAAGAGLVSSAIATWWLHHRSPLVALDNEVALHLEVGEKLHSPLATNSL